MYFKNLLKKYAIYLLRWQLSTPTLFLVIYYTNPGLTGTILANLIGGLIFFWVDRKIFSGTELELWNAIDNHPCGRCGVDGGIVWRLVVRGQYDKRGSKPLFLCQACSEKKILELKLKTTPFSELGRTD